jgi:hypothetical protein
VKRSSLVVLLVSGTLVASAAGAARVSAAPKAPSGNQNVIVMLRNQHADTPASRAGSARRTALVTADQSPLRTKVAQLKGHVTHAYSTLNALAATVPASAVAGLRSDPNVAAVVPDLNRTLPAHTDKQATAAAGTPASAVGLCPTDPAKPQLEPEALGLTHTASDDPHAQTARSLGYDGKGVKVAFIADGLDVDQPDFIRADGSHVITDYQDFTGDGINADTSGAEAFGDAGSIAAQGRHVYDISTFVNPAHPLPAGCNIRIEGFAPGVSVVALKVFSNELLTAPTSTIIQAIDYAVNVAHVDVINESFGSNPYPDTADDPISQFNHDAVDAGVTVVGDTGDAGIGNTYGTAGSDPWVIGAGATTSEKVYAQQGSYGFQLSNGQWTSNQVSALSGAGISQTNKVMDALAPGDLGWSLCSDKKNAAGDPQYVGCVDNNGQPTDMQVFGGTSQSTPFISGESALIIQAYRSTHHGASPTPAQVQAIVDESADDLGLPSAEQGGGLINSYRAVQLARTVHGGTPSGSGLTTSATQLSTVADPGSTVTHQVKVTNSGAGTQRVDAAVRQVTKVIGQTKQTVNLDATNTFVDQLGRTCDYTTTTFKVPVGTDRLFASVTWPGAAGPLARLVLLDPHGTFTAYSLPQGVSNVGQVDVHQAAPGTWTAMIFSIRNGTHYAGPVNLRTVDQRASSAGSVSPSSFTLAQGQSRTVTVRTTAPANEATADSLVLTGRFGQATTVPVITRAVQKVRFGHPARFSGTFEIGNGRSFSPAQTNTYLFKVPSGARDLDVNLNLSGKAAVAHLSDPSGEPVANDLNQRPSGDATVTDSGLQIVHANPVPGVWQLTIELLNPVSGDTLPLPFSGVVGLDGARVVSHGVPSSRGTRVHGSSTATVTIYNTSPQPQSYFIDPRSSRTATYSLVAVGGKVAGDPFTSHTALPLPSDDADVLPSWLVPTQVRSLTVGASASDSIDYDIMPLDSPTAINSPNNPDIEAPTGTSSSVTHRAHEVGSSMWAAFPTIHGLTPPDGTPPGGSVDFQASIEAAAFASDITSSTGDALLSTVDPSAPAATPVVIPAGGHATVTVTLAPTGARGSVERGALYVDTLNPFGSAGTTGLVDEVAAIPFEFTIG